MLLPSVTDGLIHDEDMLLPPHYKYDVMSGVMQRDEGPSQNETLYSITKSGPCITGSSYKPRNVYLLQDIWTCRPVVWRRDIRALIPFAEAGSVLPELRGHRISISYTVFLFFPEDRGIITPRKNLT